MRELICDVNYCARALRLRYGSNDVNDVSASLLHQFA